MDTNYDQNNMLAMPNYGMASQYVNEPQAEDDGLDGLELSVIFCRVGQLFGLYAGGATLAYTFPVVAPLMGALGTGIALFLTGLALKTKGDQSWLLGLAMAAMVIGTANGLWGAISILLIEHGFKLAVVSAIFVTVIIAERMAGKKKAQPQQQQTQMFMPMMPFE